MSLFLFSRIFLKRWISSVVSNCGQLLCFYSLIVFVTISYLLLHPLSMKKSEYDPLRPLTPSEDCGALGGMATCSSMVRLFTTLKPR